MNIAGRITHRIGAFAQARPIRTIIVAFLVYFLALLVFAATFGQMGGCASLPAAEVSEIQQRGGAAVSVLNQQIEAARERLASIEADTAEYRQALQSIEATEAIRDKAQQALDALESARGDDGSLAAEDAVGGLSTLLPPPFNVIVPLVVVGGVGVMREVKVRRLAGEIVGAIEKAKRRVQSLNEGFDQASETIEANMSTSTRAFVEKARKKAAT